MSVQRNKINFVHLRAFATSQFSGQPSPVPNATGGLTVAWTLAGDGTLKLAVAVCNQKDHYDKSTGRQLSTERLEQGALIGDKPNPYYLQLDSNELVAGIFPAEQIAGFANAAFGAELAHFMAGRKLEDVLKYESVESVITQNAIGLISPYAGQLFHQNGVKLGRLQRRTKAEKQAQSARLAALATLQEAANHQQDPAL